MVNPVTSDDLGAAIKTMKKQVKVFFPTINAPGRVYNQWGNDNRQIMPHADKVVVTIITITLPTITQTTGRIRDVVVDVTRDKGAEVEDARTTNTIIKTSNRMMDY
jgi:hypothetical protein